MITPEELINMLNKNSNINNQIIQEKIDENIKVAKEEIKDEVNDIIQDEHEYLKTVCSMAENVISGTLSTISILTRYLKDAPALDTNADYGKLLFYDKDKNKKSDDEIIKIIIMYDKEKKLVPYLGDIIIKYYKKENPKDQSIWNSDTTRLNYLIRELIDTELTWTCDKAGLKVNEFIIIPLLKLLRNIFDNKLQKNSKLPLNELTDKYFENMLLREMINKFDEKKFQDSINKYISPYFYFDKKKFVKKSKAKKINSLKN
jgi:hypothetical protein